MTDTKIQLRGHCQVCGRIQAVQRGTMSKHGYTVDFGYFNGVCGGHDYRPLEEDRSRLDQMVKHVAGLIKDDEKLIKDHQNGKVHPASVSNGRGGSFKKMIPWAELTSYQKENATKQAIYQIESRIRMATMWTRDMLALASNVHGKEVKQVVKDQAKPQIVVGSRVKVYGREVIVTKIEGKRASGVGPGINGQHVDHVFWEENGKTFAYPKRYVKLVGLTP